LLTPKLAFSALTANGDFTFICRGRRAHYPHPGSERRISGVLRLAWTIRLRYLVNLEGLIEFMGCKSLAIFLQRPGVISC